MPNLLTQSKIINTPENLSFHIDKTAWYAVNITTRVKSEKQRGKQETDDEEITLQLDKFTFPKPNTKNDLKDAPAAFSGGSQHNQEKTVHIIVVLGLGEHTLTLSPQYQAEIISVWYEPLVLTDNKISLKLNKKSESRDEQPWITFALVSHRFNQVTIKAKIWWHFFNGDDLQIRINGTIIPHQTNSKRHQHWVFHARAVLDTFGREQVETRLLPKISPEQKISYVELWADKTPLFQGVVFEGEDLQKEIELVDANLFQTQKYSLGTNDQNFNRYDDLIVEIIAKLNQEFSTQPFPPTEPLDPSLVKAMMHVESKAGYYQAPPGSYPASPM